MSLFNENFNSFFESILFFLVTNFCLLFMAWMWRRAKPFSLPQSLPLWFKIWLGIIWLIGIILPILTMLLWGLWWSHTVVLQAMIPYFIMLALQGLSEKVILKVFQSSVWAIIPCFYLPYRIWQLHSGLTLLVMKSEPILVQKVLLLEMIFWLVSYVVHLSQIPTFLNWNILEDE